MPNFYLDDCTEKYFDFISVIYISFYITDVVVEVISPIGDIIHFSDVTEIVQIKTKRGVKLGCYS
jgi:hypothetical protein